MSGTDKQEKQSLKSVASSVLSAFLGVQSSKKREEDFTRGKPTPYIIVGLIGTILFVLILVGVVQLITSLTAQ